MKLVSTTPTPIESASELQEEIRRRAYELYEQRAKDDGNELRDWLQAKSEVVQHWSRKPPHKNQRTNRSGRAAPGWGSAVFRRRRLGPGAYVLG